MRLMKALAFAVAVASFGMMATPDKASAFGWDRPDQRPYYGYSGGRPDPYAYRYVPRGYYPYYNSTYWGSPRIKRRRAGALPPYYKAWGSPKRRYYHVEWHRRHYGGHRRGDW